MEKVEMKEMGAEVATPTDLSPARTSPDSSPTITNFQRPESMQVYRPSADEDEPLVCDCPEGDELPIEPLVFNGPQVDGLSTELDYGKQDSSRVVVDINKLNCPEWLKKALWQLDANHNGLEKEEIDGMLSRLAREKDAREKDHDELEYDHLPPKVQEVLRGWDLDQSGTVGVQELLAAADAQKKMSQQNRMMKRLLALSVVVIIILAVLNFCTGLAAVESGKDFRPSNNASKAAQRRLQEDEWSRRLQSMRNQHSRRLQGEPDVVDEEVPAVGSLVNVDGSNVNVAMNQHEFTDLAQFVIDRHPMHETCTEFHTFDQEGNPESRKIVNSEFLPDGPLQLLLADGESVTVFDDGRIRRQPKDKSLPAKTVGPLPPQPRIFAKRPPPFFGKLRCAALPVDLPKSALSAKIPALRDVCERIDGEVRCSKERFQRFVQDMNSVADKLDQDQMIPEDADKVFDSRDCNQDGFISQREFDAHLPCPQSKKDGRRLHLNHFSFAQRRSHLLHSLRRRRRLQAGNYTEPEPWMMDFMPGDQSSGTILDHNAVTTLLKDTPMYNNEMGDLSKAFAVFDECDADRNGVLSGEEQMGCDAEKKWNASQDPAVGSDDMCPCVPPDSPPRGITRRQMKNGNYPRKCIKNFKNMDISRDRRVTREECINFFVPAEDRMLHKVCESNNLIYGSTGLFTKEHIMRSNPDTSAMELDLRDHNSDGYFTRNDLRMELSYHMTYPPLFPYDINEEDMYMDPLADELARNTTSNSTRRLEQTSFRSLHDDEALISRRRFAYELALQPVLEERHHTREIRRLKREIHHRKLEMKMHRGDLGKYNSWINERRAGAQKHLRRLSESNGSRKKYELKRLDIITLSDDELNALTVPFHQSHRHRKLQETFGHLPRTHRRLLGIRETGRQLRGEFANSTEMYSNYTDSFVAETMGSASSYLSEAELAEATRFVKENAEHIMDPEIIEDMKHQPCTFNSFRKELVYPEDFNDSPFPVGSTVLAGKDLVHATMKVMGLKEDQAKRRIRKHMKKHKSAHAHRILTIKAADPFRQRLLSGHEFHDPSMAGYDHMDMCTWLEMTSRVNTHMQLMAVDGVREACNRGEKDCCVPPDTQSQAMFGIHTETVEPGHSICIQEQDRILNAATMQSNPHKTDTKMNFATYAMNKLYTAEELPLMERMAPPLVPAVPTCHEDVDGSMPDHGECTVVPPKINVNDTAAQKIFQYDNISEGCAATCCKNGDVTNCKGKNKIKPCHCQRQKKKVAKKIVDGYLKAKGGKKGKGKLKKRMQKHAREKRRQRGNAKRMNKRNRRKLQNINERKAHHRRRLQQAHCYQKVEEWACNGEWNCTWDVANSYCSPTDDASLSEGCTMYNTDLEMCDYMEGCGADWYHMQCKRCEDIDVYECYSPNCMVEHDRCISTHSHHHHHEMDFETACMPQVSPMDAFYAATGNSTYHSRRLQEWEPWSDEDMWDAVGHMDTAEKEIYDAMLHRPGVNKEFTEMMEVMAWDDYPLDPMEVQEFMDESSWESYDAAYEEGEGEDSEWVFDDIMYGTDGSVSYDDEWEFDSEELMWEEWDVTDEMDTDNDGFVGEYELNSLVSSCMEGSGDASFNVDYCAAAEMGATQMHTYAGKNGLDSVWSEGSETPSVSPAPKLRSDDFTYMTDEQEDREYHGKVMYEEFSCYHATVHGVPPEESAPLYEKLASSPSDGIPIHDLMHPPEKYATQASATGEQISPDYYEKMAVVEEWNQDIEMGQECIEELRYEQAEMWVMDHHNDEWRRRLDMISYGAMPNEVSGYALDTMHDLVAEAQGCLHRMAHAYEEIGDYNGAADAYEWANKAANATTAFVGSVNHTDLGPMPLEAQHFWSDIEPTPPACGIQLEGEVIPCDEFVEKEEHWEEGPDHWCGDMYHPCEWHAADMDPYYMGEPSPSGPRPILIEPATVPENTPIHPCDDRFLKEHAHCWEMTEKEFRAEFHRRVNEFLSGGQEDKVKHCMDMHRYEMSDPEHFCRSQLPSKVAIKERDITRVWNKFKLQGRDVIPLPDYDCFSLYEHDMYHVATKCTMDEYGNCFDTPAPLDLFEECSKANRLTHLGQVVSDLVWSVASSKAAQIVWRRLEELDHLPHDARQLRTESTDHTTHHLFAGTTRFEHRSPVRQSRRLRLAKLRRRHDRRHRRRLHTIPPTLPHRSLLDRALEMWEEDYDDFGSHADMYAHEMAWEQQYEKSLQDWERRLLDDLPTFLSELPSWDFTWLMDEVRMTYYTIMPATDTDYLCAELSWVEDFSVLTVSEQNIFINCISPAIGGIPREFLELMHSVEKGNNSPTILLEYLKIEQLNQDPQEILAKDWASNHVAMHSLGDGHCTCACVMYDRTWNQPALEHSGCAGTVATPNGDLNICDSFRAAAEFGYIDTEYCSWDMGWQTQLRRLSGISEKVHHAASILPESPTRRLQKQVAANKKITKKTAKLLKQSRNKRGHNGSKKRRRRVVNGAKDRKELLTKYAKWKKAKGMYRR